MSQMTRLNYTFPIGVLVAVPGTCCYETTSMYNAIITPAFGLQPRTSVSHDPGGNTDTHVDEKGPRLTLLNQ